MIILFIGVWQEWWTVEISADWYGKVKSFNESGSRLSREGQL